MSSIFSFHVSVQTKKVSLPLAELSDSDSDDDDDSEEASVLSPDGRFHKAAIGNLLRRANKP